MNIQPVIGSMRLCDVKPMRRKIILNRMGATYTGSTIRSEMIGLTWDAIDWKKRTLTVSKTLEYRHGEGIWRAGPPKTASSYRTIPLTTRAYDVLKSCYDERHTRKEAV